MWNASFSRTLVTVACLWAVAIVQACSRSSLRDYVSSTQPGDAGLVDSGAGCLSVGASCSTFSDCCTTLCIGGTCKAPEPRCLPDGADCSESCCAGACLRGKCGVEHHPVGCLAGGDLCKSDGDCCAGNCSEGECEYAACYSSEGLTPLLHEVGSGARALTVAGDQVYFLTQDRSVGLLRAVSLWGGAARTILAAPVGYFERVASSSAGIFTLASDGTLFRIDLTTDHVTQLDGPLPVPPFDGRPLYLSAHDDVVIASGGCAAASCPVRMIRAEGTALPNPFSASGAFFVDADYYYYGDPWSLFAQSRASGVTLSTELRLFGPFAENSTTLFMGGSDALVVMPRPFGPLRAPDPLFLGPGAIAADDVWVYASDLAENALKAWDVGTYRSTRVITTPSPPHTSVTGLALSGSCLVLGQGFDSTTYELDVLYKYPRLR
jgi:hypothetical protein